MSGWELACGTAALLHASQGRRRIDASQDGREMHWRWEPNQSGTRLGRDQAEGGLAGARARGRQGAAGLVGEPERGSTVLCSDKEAGGSCCRSTDVARESKEACWWWHVVLVLVELIDLS
jgi:hypothetical protein